MSAGAESGKGAVAIVGGGPAGLALALALRQQGMAAEIFEARSREKIRIDARILALSHGSRQILERLGAWPHAAATPIQTIHVSHRGGLGRTRMHAPDIGVPALGYVLAAGDLIDALDTAARAADIPYRDHTRLTAADPLLADFLLTAWAEGAVDADDATSRDYDQHAVLCTVQTAMPHQHVAWERFTSDGPVALLPLGQHYAVVLTVTSSVVEHIRSLDDVGFLAHLQQRFGDRHRFTAVSPRVDYPLGLRWRKSPVGERQVWLGNAAQTLHPVAGQGFNLALRDIWELAQASGNSAHDPGASDVLAAYAARRQLDRRGAIGFTNLLIDGFASDFAPVRHMRGAALLALDLIPPLRNFVARRMMFGARVWP